MNIKTHHFDIADAIKYGTDCAILLYNIKYWSDKNKANGHNLHDGKYWTYNSVKAFTILFPYWSEKQVRTYLSKLESLGAIVSGNYNESPYDRTKWYALADESKVKNLEPVRVSSTCPNGQMSLPDGANETAQNGEPIPYKKPDINSDNKQQQPEKKIDVVVEEKNDFSILEDLKLDEAIKALAAEKEKEKNCAKKEKGKFAKNEEFRNLILSDDYAWWREDKAMTHHISEKKVISIVEEFISNLRGKDMVYKDKSSFMTHLHNLFIKKDREGVFKIEKVRDKRFKI